MWTRWEKRGEKRGEKRDNWYVLVIKKLCTTFMGQETIKVLILGLITFTSVSFLSNHVIMLERAVVFN